MEDWTDTTAKPYRLETTKASSKPQSLPPPTPTPTFAPTLPSQSQPSTGQTQTHSSPHCPPSMSTGLPNKNNVHNNTNDTPEYADSAAANEFDTVETGHQHHHPTYRVPACKCGLLLMGVQVFLWIIHVPVKHIHCKLIPVYGRVNHHTHPDFATSSRYLY